MPPEPENEKHTREATLDERRRPLSSGSSRRGRGTNKRGRGRRPDDGKESSGLWLRVTTALLMAGILLLAIFLLPQRAWALLLIMPAAFAAWEWAALCRLKTTGQLLLTLLIVSLCLSIIAYLPQWVTALRSDSYQASGDVTIYGAATIFWVVLVPMCLRYRWHIATPIFGSICGLVVIFPAWLAMVQMRTMGTKLFIAILAGIFIADIAAYFSGKMLGKHKLAPNISPAKTWEGAIISSVAVTIYGLLLCRHYQFDLLPGYLLLALFVGLTSLSIAGDLFESWFKRQANIKNSGNLLPGHGGFLDRIDSLCSTLPVIAFLWFYLRY